MRIVESLTADMVSFLVFRDSSDTRLVRGFQFLQNNASAGFVPNGVALASAERFSVGPLHGKRCNFKPAASAVG